jgi:hypothetical protein
MLKTALEAIASPRRDHLRDNDTDPDTVAADGGEAEAEAQAADAAPDGGRDLVPYATRMGQALCELAEKLDADHLPVAAGVNATVVVTVDERQLRDRVGAASLSTGDDLSVADARRLACTANLLPMVLDGESQPLDLGRSARLFDKAQRIALAARDGGCVFPGCHRPPAWAEAHHVTPWSLGGETDLDNGALLCGRHHRLIHHGVWDIRIGADKLPEVIPPERVDPSAGRSATPASDTATDNTIDIDPAPEPADPKQGLRPTEHAPTRKHPPRPGPILDNSTEEDDNASRRDAAARAAMWIQLAGALPLPRTTSVGSLDPHCRISPPRTAPTQPPTLPSQTPRVAAITADLWPGRSESRARSGAANP